MSLSLYEAFESFCSAMDGKLKWGEDSKIWTSSVLCFFDGFARSKGYIESQANYMEIDTIWRDQSCDYIVLALEHENERNVREFLRKEIRHLIDLKAENKIAITYPHLGEEREAAEAIRAAIQRAVMTVSPLLVERYLIIFGIDTWREGRRAILWKGYFISGTGEMEERHAVVLQKSWSNC